MSSANRSARGGLLGLAALLGVANFAQMLGASLLATMHLWTLKWNDFGPNGTAFRDLSIAAIALACMPALGIAAWACWTMVWRPHGPQPRLRRRLGTAWAVSLLLAAGAWALLGPAAQYLRPFPWEHAAASAAGMIVLGLLPAWWLADTSVRSLTLLRPR